MSLRRIIFSLLVVCLSLIGLACGLLCVLCLVAYVLLRGLGIGSAVLALLCLSCLGLAVMLSGRAAKRESKRLGSAGPRFLKTWWPFRSAGVGQPTGSASIPPALAEGSVPTKFREAEHWPEELRPYGEWSELPDNVGPHQNPKR